LVYIPICLPHRSPSLSLTSCGYWVHKSEDLDPCGTQPVPSCPLRRAPSSSRTFKLNGGALAYLHIVNPAVTAIEKGSEPDPGALRMLELMREKYRGTLVIAGGFDHDTAESWLQQGKADLIAFGRKFWPIQTCRNGFVPTPPLTPTIRPPTMAAAPKGIPTIPLLPRSGARNRTPALTKGGDSGERSHIFAL
jgi:hypothetical protein